LIGRIAAGALMTAEENTEGWIRLPTSFFRPSSAVYFLLQVTGNSMNRAAVDGVRIEDGDLVLVRQQSKAQPRDIVVAFVDGEATVKRLIRVAQHWVLKPESTEAKHQPIVVGPGFQIQGIVVRVLKSGSELAELMGN